MSTLIHSHAWHTLFSEGAEAAPPCCGHHRGSGRAGSGESGEGTGAQGRLWGQVGQHFS